MMQHIVRSNASWRPAVARMPPLTPLQDWDHLRISGEKCCEVGHLGLSGAMSRPLLSGEFDHSPDPRGASRCPLAIGLLSRCVVLVRLETMSRACVFTIRSMEGV